MTTITHKPIEPNDVALGHDLKQLKTRLAKLETELSEAQATASEAQKQAALVRQRRDELKKAVETYGVRADKVVVSEHAMLRYIERVMGLDLEKLKAEMVPPGTAAAIATFKSGKFPTPTCRLVVKESTVVTVETEE